MSAYAFILCCLAMGQTAPASWPSAPKAPQLPNERCCQLCYEECDEDVQRLVVAIELSGGWRRRQLLEILREANRRRAIWYAAWWVTWKRATPAQREEWTEILCGCIGRDAFWRGELPEPIGLGR